MGCKESNQRTKYRTIYHSYFKNFMLPESQVIYLFDYCVKLGDSCIKIFDLGRYIDRFRVGVTIVAKNYYCDSIDIAGSTIAILLLLWTTIAMLL